VKEVRADGRRLLLGDRENGTRCEVATPEVRAVLSPVTTRRRASEARADRLRVPDGDVEYRIEVDRETDARRYVPTRTAYDQVATGDLLRSATPEDGELVEDVHVGEAGGNARLECEVRERARDRRVARGGGQRPARSGPRTAAVETRADEGPTAPPVTRECGRPVCRGTERAPERARGPDAADTQHDRLDPVDVQPLEVRVPRVEGVTLVVDGRGREVDRVGARQRSLARLVVLGPERGRVLGEVVGQREALDVLEVAHRPGRLLGRRPVLDAPDAVGDLGHDGRRDQSSLLGRVGPLDDGDAEPFEMRARAGPPRRCDARSRTAERTPTPADSLTVGPTHDDRPTVRRGGTAEGAALSTAPGRTQAPQ
jgi:hypothetical protein